MPATAPTSSRCGLPARPMRRWRRPAAASSRRSRRCARRARTSWSAQSLPRLDALIAEGVTTIEIKSGYGLDLENEAKSLRAARRLGDERHGHGDAPPSSARMRCRRKPRATRTPTSTMVADEMLPAIAAEGLADAVDGFCEGIAFSPEQIARVFDAAKALGLPVKLHADQLSNLHGAALAARYGALSADHLEYTDEAGAAAMAQGRHGRGDPARRLLFHPRDEEAADRAVPQARREDGGRHRLQSRHLAADLAAAHHEHGGDAVRHDGRGMPCRRDARGRARARPARRDRNARGRANGPTSPSGTSSARPSSSIAWVSTRCIARVWRGR